jgi:hypothetical protein
MLGWHPSNVSGVRWTGATLNHETLGVGCLGVHSFLRYIGSGEVTMTKNRTTMVAPPSLQPTEWCLKRSGGGMTDRTSRCRSRKW